MKNILVPTDFSDNALKAALYAAEIARRNEATIFFLHATGYDAEKTYETYSGYAVTVHSLKESRKARMDIFRKSVVSVYGNIKTKIEISEGDPEEAIPEFCEKHDIDLIIMGTTGAGKVKERLVGTTAASVVASSRIPVLVVPAKYKVEKPDGILFATSHFEKKNSQLDMIVTMARLFSATVHVVVFIETDNAKAPYYMESDRELNHYLDYLTKTYPGINFRGEIVEGTHFENAIELYQTVHKTDITAMMAYPKGLWEKILHKSVTRKMVYHSHIPVLAIPSTVRSYSHYGK